MNRRAAILFTMIAVAATPAGAALSDFIPNQSVVLDPVAVDGLFEYNDIVIGESTLISVDRSVWGDQTVTLSAIGDITIRGVLDAGSGPLALRTDNHMLLDGKIYGDSLPVEAGSFSWINNPNGNDDLHRTGGVLTTLIPDAMRPADPGVAGSTGSFDIASSGAVVIWKSLKPSDILGESAVIASGNIGVPAFIATTPVPLPPAALLFGAALVALSARLRRSV